MNSKRSIELQTYVAFCASCGHRLMFSIPYTERFLESFESICSGCKRRWSFVFDIDESGTFGVVSFQCDNGDRK